MCVQWPALIALFRRVYFNAFVYSVLSKTMLVLTYCNLTDFVCHLCMERSIEKYRSLGEFFSIFCSHWVTLEFVLINFSTMYIQTRWLCYKIGDTFLFAGFFPSNVNLLLRSIFAIIYGNTRIRVVVSVSSSCCDAPAYRFLLFVITSIFGSDDLRWYGIVAFPFSICESFDGT